MSKDLTPEKIAELRSLLDQRLRSLWKEIRAELAERDEQQLSKLPGEIHDFEEASVSDIYVELNLVLLKHHQRELVALQAALKRIKNGIYGICTDCGEVIKIERLRANPSAHRCVNCQEVHEAQAAH